MNNGRYVVSQVGAREHYALAIAAQSKDKLKHLYTDFWASRPIRAVLDCGPGQLASLSARYDSRIPSGKITSYNHSAIVAEYQRRKTKEIDKLYRLYENTGRRFCENVNKSIGRHCSSGDIFIGYNTGSLETLRFVKQHGMIGIVDQIDPAQLEEELVFQEWERFPDWQMKPHKIPDSFYHRLKLEWAVADHVIVNSSWSKNALIRQDVPKEKIHIVPLAYAPRRVHAPCAPTAEIRVLFLGQVILRKGIQYLVEAAKKLQNKSITFTVAGSCGITEKALASFPDNIKYIGKVERSGLSEVYSRHDVFILPTISDGFAITQLEAMAHGLPVIATRCCGEVVTHGVDGMIIRERNAEAIAEAIMTLFDDRVGLEEMKKNALTKSTAFGYDSLYEKIAGITAGINKNSETF